MAVHVTVVVPIENVLPLVLLQTGVILPLTRSIAETTNVTGAPAADCAISTGTVGSVNAGGVVSVSIFTMYVTVCEAPLPTVSVAATVKLFEPTELVSMLLPFATGPEHDATPEPPSEHPSLAAMAAFSRYVA